MSRRLVIAAALVLLAALAWVWLADDESSLEGPGDATAQRPADDAPPPRKRDEPRGARVSGFVMRDGQPVPNARVSLKTTAPLVTLTLDDGRFLFEDVPSGQVYLAANTADAASEVLGPFQLTPGAAVEGVQLVLTPSVKIDGRVIDLLTQRPVAGATLISPAQVMRSDEAGRFTLTGAKSQTWIEVTAPGFLNRTEWVSLELASAGGKLELVLTPSSRLEGVVLESGAPIAAATVWAETTEGARHGERSLNVFTDKEGKFSLECAAGALQLSAVTPRGTRVRGPLIRVSVGEKKTGLVLDAGDVTSASGVVTRGGQPVSGAQVSAIDAQTEDVSALATTTFDGRFRFDGLSLGKYVLQVRAGALTAVAGPFEHRGDGLSWTVTLAQGGTLVGRVEPPSAGVAVRWRSGTWSGPSAQTVTDAAGQFRFEGLPEELVSLDAEGPAGAATARAKAGDEVVLVLQRGFVTVRLRDEAGGPVTDGVLTARSLDTGAARRQLVLAPDGVTRLDLPTGRWELSLEVSGRGRSAAVQVTVGTAGAEATLSLESSVIVSGRVIDRATSLPVAGARVEAFSGEVGRASRLSVLTDARGEFQLPPVPRSGTLGVSREGFASQWRRVADGPRWDVTLDALPPQHPRNQSDFNQFEGVGMTLDARSGPVMVALVSEGSPAERAGVQVGDQILAVDGGPVAGQKLEQVVARIRGPAGTPVVIRFQRAGQVFELTLRRKLLSL